LLLFLGLLIVMSDRNVSNFRCEDLPEQSWDPVWCGSAKIRWFADEIVNRLPIVR